MREAASNGRSSRFFWFACAAESALLIVAFVIARLVGHPLLTDLHWSFEDFLLGLAASAPLLLVFWWMLRSSIEPLARIRRILVSGLRPLFAPWSLLQLGIISVLAGICEEVLFRSVIQGALSVTAGPVMALIVASVLFGVVHLVTLGYAIIAGVIGAYLGVLWLWGGNLLIPITVHAAYDFAALVCFLRFWEPGGPADG
ncbi:MAG: CPBP family intramembrane glutamic endopeptidase [Gammaproteobacteria bacterium]|nr:CPBP family intramembrane glutamic endopeptidase [Gammaproteobacteria bacterium]